jgi:ubiquinone/menaquinone biosynthesis C-methylase UbiE
LRYPHPPRGKNARNRAGEQAGDEKTAAAFANSWNNLPSSPVYTKTQVDDWLEPLSDEDIRGKELLELGCGGGHLLTHILEKKPAWCTGVDLGDSLASARRNLSATQYQNWNLVRADLCGFQSEKGFDVVICIGVLHHLQEPYTGFSAMLRNTKAGGKFHGWVYGHEGNFIVRTFIDPLRRLTSKLPWRAVKYLVATPLAFIYFLYAKTLVTLPDTVNRHLPLAAYSRWIARRELAFFRHVAFDQLVTPRTVYFRREDVRKMLENELIDPRSVYLIQRNGNSWKFGGIRR